MTAPQPEKAAVPRPGFVRVVVAAPTQVLFDGKVYNAREELEAPYTEAAEQWLAAGYVALAEKE